MKRFFVYIFLMSLSTVTAQTTSDRFSILNVDANTRNNEFGTILTDDGSIFYSKSTYKNSPDFNEKGANLYKGVLEPKGQISKGLKFPTDATHAVFTKDGTTVYYSKKNGNKNFQLYRARIDRTGRWKNNTLLPFNNPNYTYKQPALNQDNTKLFFVSNMPGGFGGNDIYSVSIEDKGINFGEPVNLGENINTLGNEMYPFVGHKDKLFFSTDARKGLGGLDIYESFFEEGYYTNTNNLNAPINSEKDDFAYVLIPGTNKGYFSSNRVDGFGGVDIYYFEDKKPSLNKCKQAIEGIVKNKSNQKGIFEVTVEIFNSQDHIGTQLTNYKGEFLFDNVECTQRYDIVCYKEGWNGFAEVQTVPESGNKLILYLDTDFPEEYVEEFDVSDELVVYDTQTNKVIKPDTDLDADLEEEGLSFAEKRERDRIKKERIKKERIAAEREAERIEKQKQEAARLAAAEAKRLAADKEKNERIAKAKAMAKKLRRENELAQKTEAERKEAERIEAEKLAAQEQEEERILAEQERQRKLEEVRIANEKKQKQERLEQERIANELAEKKRIEEEKQAALAAERDALEKERQERIAKAQETADKLRAEQELADKQAKENTTQDELVENQNQDKNIPDIQTDTQEVIAENTASEQNNQKSDFELQQELIKKERQERIAKAQETANRLRAEQERTKKEIEKTVALDEQRKKDLRESQANLRKLITKQKKATQTKTSNKNKIAAIQKREKRIQEEKAKTEKLLKEQLAAVDEQIQKQKSTQELEQRIAEAQATADRLRKEQNNKAQQEITPTSDENQVIVNNTVTNENTEMIAPKNKEIVDNQNQMEPSEQVSVINEKAAQSNTKNNTEISQNNASTTTSVNQVHQAENKQNETEEITQDVNYDNTAPCARNIDGFIQNSVTGEGLSNATIDMYFDGQNIESTSTNQKGEFHFYNIDCNTNYTLICFKKDFNNIAKADINTESIPDQIVLLLDPDPIEEEVIVKKEIPEENSIAIVDEIQPAPKKPNTSKEPKTVIPKKNTTTKKTTITPKVQKKEEPKVTAPKKEIADEEEKLVTQDEPKIEVPKIKEGKILINPIYFDLDEYYLTLPARRELDKIIVIMRQNPTMIIESGSHTDTRGNFDYNLQLSEKRSQEVVGYLVANGADPDRISGRGYGETMPVNHCYDGVKCSESEHLENRRTEFVILHY